MDRKVEIIAQETLQYGGEGEWWIVLYEFTNQIWGEHSESA